jgi:hypothetical protein
MSEEEIDYNTTTSTKTRWEYIATLLAGVMVLSLPVLVLGAALGPLSLAPISQGWYLLYGTVVMMAATWAFGKETLEAAKEALGK